MDVKNNIFFYISIALFLMMICIVFIFPAFQLRKLHKQESTEFQYVVNELKQRKLYRDLGQDRSSYEDEMLIAEFLSRGGKLESLNDSALVKYYIRIKKEIPDLQREVKSQGSNIDGLIRINEIEAIQSQYEAVVQEMIKRKLLSLEKVEKK